LLFAAGTAPGSSRPATSKQVSMWRSRVMGPRVFIVRIRFEK
jgi:hypothetical protein